MKKYLFLVMLSPFAFSGCSKDGNLSSSSAQVNNSSVEFTDTVKIPINDLGKRTYLGFRGGLYPHANDTPSGQYAKDLLHFASHITPLDSNGKPSENGKIVFISLGVSTGGHNMYALMAKTIGNPRTNPSLLLANCNNGSGNASLNSLMNPNDLYWIHVSLILRSYHISYKQVQVIYLETDDSSAINSFPERPYQVRDDFKIAMQVCKAKFKHLRLVYVLGRTTTFSKIQVQNIEPCPYYNGWGEKFFIEDQINGAPGTKYKGDSAVAPLVTWGWYQWADGTNIPRKDGFVWTKDDTIDGLHADPAGQDTLATRFQNFLLTDRYASIWYANHSPQK
jgi:hypothetical protein